MEWQEAKDIKKKISELVKTLSFSHVKTLRIYCYRSYGSKSRSYARIWQFPKIFQKALKVQPAYVIEVLSKHFDKLDQDNQKKVLIHELLHIPKNFSGALLPHRTRKRSLHKITNQLFTRYKSLSK